MKPRKIEVIGDFGLGSPNERVSLWFLLRLIWEQFGIWGYAQSNGIEKAQEAVVAYKRNRHGVVLDPCKNVRFSPKGTRIIYPFLIQLILEQLKRTEVVMTLPFYPGHLKAVRWAGGKAVFLAALSAVTYVDRLEEKLRKGGFHPAAVIICSIGNPYGYKCDLESFRRLVALAHEFGFILIVDEAYAELSYDCIPAPSPFEVEGALPVTVATMTGSKFLSAAAGGIGLSIGPERILQPLSENMEFLSEGGNGLIQSAFAFALPHIEPYVRNLAKLYDSRAHSYADLLYEAGLYEAKSGVGDGGMFLWVPTDDLSSNELADRAQSEGVIIRPGSMFLDTGDDQRPGNMNFLRFCLRERDQVAARSFRALRPLITTMRIEKCENSLVY
ncbi:MAG: pyridoxal phosphate-dependent aminotransferase [Candidatus Doudnabacteria bacterium]|nr:pyridoxal phosphate-dependent aminotransferase [Candidatus Doudnabacteria bacterium]